MNERRVLRSVHDAILRCRAVAFWIAVVSPFVYLPLAFAGLSTTETRVLFGGLVVLHVVALYAGHPHRRADAPPARAESAQVEPESAREVRA